MNFSDFKLVLCNKINPGVLFSHNGNIYKMLRLLKNDVKALNLSSNEIEKFHRWDYTSLRRNTFIYAGLDNNNKSDKLVRIIDSKILLKALKTDDEFKQRVENLGLSIENIINNLES
jgi:hypothetical protein